MAAPRGSRTTMSPYAAAAQVGLESEAVVSIQRCQMLDQPVAPLHRLAALHGLAVVEHRARGQVAVAVSVLREELGWERVGEIARDGFCRVSLYAEQPSRIAGSAAQGALIGRHNHAPLVIARIGPAMLAYGWFG
jgi:hypothetical protein